MADPWVIAAMLDDFRKCPRCQTWELADCEAGLGCNPMTKEQR